MMVGASREGTTRAFSPARRCYGLEGRKSAMVVRSTSGTRRVSSSRNPHRRALDSGEHVDLVHCVRRGARLKKEMINGPEGGGRMTISYFFHRASKERGYSAEIAHSGGERSSRPQQNRPRISAEKTLISCSQRGKRGQGVCRGGSGALPSCRNDHFTIERRDWGALQLHLAVLRRRRAPISDKVRKGRV